MGEDLPASLELEIAVIRGQDWAYRATFRPPAMVSIGASPSAVLSLPDTDLPEYHELLRIYSDGGVLYFQPGMAVELRVAEGTKRNDELLDEGLAVRGGAGWKVPLGLGSRGAFRVADVSVLFKVREHGRQELRKVQVGSPTLCGACSATLSFVVPGFGALSPCQSCGVLNEVLPVRPPALAGGETEIAPVVKRHADLPTFDAISVGGTPAVAPMERVARERLSDLPTFDSISIGGTPSVQGPRKATGDQLSMPTQKLAQLAPDGGGAQIGPGEPPKPAAAPVIGADLPTFDAISILKDDGLLATHAAMDMMRGGTDAEPPITDLDGAVTVAEDAPGPSIPYLSGTSRWSPGSEIEVTVEDENEFFDEDAPVSMDLQRSYNAIPVMKLDAAPVRSEEFAGGPTRLVPVPRAVAAGVTEIPDTIEEAAPIGWDGSYPASGRTSSMPETDEPVSATREMPAKAEPRAAAPNLVPITAPAPSTVPAPRAPRDGTEGSDADDFLMGRVSIPDADGVRETNRWLVVVGAVSGVIGLGLILYALFG